MYRHTDEEMMHRVAACGRRHQEIYDFIAGYYHKYGVSPVIKDVTADKTRDELLTVYLCIRQLAEAGCVIQNSGYGLVPLLSPEEALHWCTFLKEDQDECERILILKTIEYTFQHGGEQPTIEDLLDPYENSELYHLIKSRAEKLLKERFALSEELHPHVGLSDYGRHSVMKLVTVYEKEEAVQAD